MYAAYVHETGKGNLVLTYLPERDVWDGERKWHDDEKLKAALNDAHLYRVEIADEVLDRALLDRH